MAKGVPQEGQLALPMPEPGTGSSAASAPKARRRRRGSAGKSGSPQGRSAAGSVSCQQCGSSIDVPKWYRDRGISLHYCSERCRVAWTRQQPSFEVVLQPGRPGRGGNWEVQSRRARERDGFACQVCAVTEEDLGRRLDVHHQIPFSRFRSNVEANKLEHLVSVCPACHQQLEAQLRRELPLFARS